MAARWPEDMGTIGKYTSRQRRSTKDGSLMAYEHKIWGRLLHILTYKNYPAKEESSYLLFISCKIAITRSSGKGSITGTDRAVVEEKW